MSTFHRSLRLSICLCAVLLCFAAFPVGVLAQPTPTATLAPPPAPLIGESFTFPVVFDNTGSATGFGPYVDLVLPANGVDGQVGPPDDGITFVSATYLGQPVTAIPITFDGSGNATHPYARTLSGTPVVVAGAPGDQLVVLQLPFGSFTPDQPPAEIQVSVDLSDLADLGTALNLRARGGFRYGTDALDNPPSDPSTIGAYTADIPVVPSLWTLAKTYIGPEDETATGPNFPRQYRIDVDVATGQTVTALDITDVLPPNMQFLAVVNTLVNGGPVSTTLVATPSLSTPGGTLTRRFATVAGSAGAQDASLIFSYYIPRVDATAAAVINPSTGDDAAAIDDARSEADWQPIDGRDAQTRATNDASANDHTLTAKSIAIQKDLTIAVDNGAAGPTPGDILQYTLSVQVSDFFAMQGLVLTDILSDGQRADGTFVPTLAISQHSGGASALAPMNAANFDFVVSGTTGETTGTFEIGAEQVTRGLLDRLLGGCVPSAGTGGPAPDCGAFNGGATTLTVVYRTVIQEDFTNTFPSGDPSVDHGDTLDNSVTAGANLLSTADAATPTGSSEADTSAESLVIATGTLTKTIYAINGNTSFGTPELGPGDTVTYRLRFTLPSSDTENLAITDFLPLPVLFATEVAGPFDTTVSAATPPAGTAKLGPDDTFFALSGIVPTITGDAGANSVAFAFGDFDDPSNTPTTIDILFTVTASDEPFADGLFLTNQVRVVEGTTNAGEATIDAIVQIQLNEPALRITKGAVASDNTADVYAPAAVGPVGFSAPGSAGFRGAGPITSAGLAGSPVNSNVSALDAGDIVTFAIVVENGGNAPDGAFDVRVRDTLPAGFVVPGSGLNLSVTDGTGTALAFTDLGGGLFGSGLELNDAGATGALAGASPSSGTNIAVITYDLELESTVTAQSILTNTATLFNYAGTEVGPDFTTVDQTDTAVAATAAPTMTKVVTGTNQAHTSGNTVAIGERVTYRVSIRVPEGHTPAAVLTDTLDPGLAILSLDAINAPAGVTAANGTFPAVLSSTTIGAVGAGAANAGRLLTLDFGELVNTNTDNTTDELITIDYSVVVLNSTGNNRGTGRNNAASLAFTGGTATAAAPNVTIVEPTLQVSKVAAPTGGDAGDAITFTVTLSHAVGSNAGAFEVNLTDVLPPQFTYVSASHQSGTAPTSFTPGGGFGASWSSFPTGSTSVFELVATINGGQGSGAVLTNTAAATYTSLPTAVTSPQSSYNTLSTERTGSTSDPGGAENDYAAQGSANVTVSAAGVNKVVTSTNQGHTTGSNVAIGEVLTYTVTVTVPEAVSNGVTLVDTLDPGLAFVAFDSLVVSNPAAVTTNAPGGFPGVLAGAAVSNPGGADPVTAGSRVTFDFGTVTNTDADSGVDETITLTYRAVVLNAAANVAGQTRNNSVAWTAGGAPVTASAPDVTIVEPALQVDKTVSPTSADAGDAVTFQMVVSHTGGTTGDAFDVTLADTLPAGFTLTSGPTIAAGVAPTSLSHAGGVISATWATFPAGASTTIEFTGTIAGTVTPGQTVTNTAAIAWTSLPGAATSLSSHNGLAAERTGNTGDPGSTANTYSASDGAGVTLLTNSLAGRVFVDADGSGVYTVGEPPLTGVQVLLSGTDHLGNAVALSTTTAVDGTYTFTALRPGTYTVREVQPSAWADGADAAGSLSGTVTNDAIAAVAIPIGTSTDATAYNFGERPTADLEVTKVDMQDPVLPGGTLTYTILVRNLGPSAALNVALRDPIPVGTSFASISPGGMTCGTPAVGTRGDLECSVASLAVGATATIVVNLQVDPTVVVGATITNGVAVRSDLVDPVAANNSDREPTSVAASSSADVAITKVDAVDPVRLGIDNIVYTLTIENRGPGAASNVEVTDVLPAGVTLVSATPSQGTCTAATCELGALASGTQATVTVEVTPSATGVVINQATATATEPDPVPDNNIATEPTTVLNPTDADLVITKIDVADPVGVGGLVIYRVTVENRGPASAANVMMAESTPAGTMFAAMVSPGGWTCVTPAIGAVGAISCSTAALAAGASAVFELHAQLDAGVPAGTTLSNTATVTSATPDPVSANNTTTEPTLVVDPTAADVAIVKTDAPDAQVAGTNVSYTLIVTNHGPAPATNVTVSDPLPAGAAFVSASTGCSEAGGQVTCGGLTLPPGASAAFGVTVAAPSAPGVMNNVATVSASETDPVPGNNSDPEPTTLVGRADVRIAKVGPSTATPGGALVYTLTITNDGPSQAETVAVADPTPAGLMFVSNAGACATAFPCALGTMMPGESRVITATFAVPSGYTTPDPIGNTATVSTTSAGDDLGNNTASTSTPLAFSADVALTKTSSTPAPGVGTTFDYIVTASNLGPSDTANVSIAETLPAGVTYITSTASRGAYDSIAASWTIPSLTAGTTAVLTITVRADVAGPLPNMVAITSSSQPDPDPGNDQATATPTAVDEADVSVVKTGPASVLAGGTVTYTLTIQNAGPARAAAVSVSDPTPANLAFVSNTGACTTAFPCALGDLQPGESRTITATYTAAIVPNGTIVTNEATVTTTTTDPNPSNDQSTATTIVNAGTDVGVTKTVSPTHVQIGQPVTFTVTATNNGPNAATGVVVTDQVPVGTAYESSMPSAGTYDQATGRWEIGALAIGQSETLTITTIVQVPGPLTNLAVRTIQNEPDDNSANDSAAAVVNGVSYADIGVAKFSTPAAPAVGTPVTFTVEVTNRGPSDAPDVVIDDPVPANVVLVSAVASTGGYAADTGRWTIGAMPVGAVATLTVVVDATQDGTITNRAAVNRTGVLDPNPLNDQDVEVVVVGPPPVVMPTNLRVTKVALRSVVASLEDAGFLITVTNDGPGTATNVVVTEPLPPALDLVGVRISQGDYASSSEWQVGTLAASQSATLQVTARPNTAGTAVNTATASAAEPDVDSSDNVASARVIVPPSGPADLQVTQQFPSVAPPNGLLTFRLVTRNLGSNVALNPYITGMIPPGTEFVSMSPSAGGTCLTPGNPPPPDPATGYPVVGTQVAPLHCTWPGLMRPGESHAVEFTVRVAPGTRTGQILWSCFWTWSQTEDPYHANNVVDAYLFVHDGVSPAADLAIQAAALSDGVIDTRLAVPVGAPVPMRFWVTNHGPVAARGHYALILDAAGAMEIVDVKLPQGWFTPTSDTSGAWETALIQPGQTVALDLTVRLANAVSVELFAQRVGGSPGDPDATNERATISLDGYDSSGAGRWVAVGNVDGAGAGEIITGTGEGEAPQVRVFSGTGVDTGMRFFAYERPFLGGVRVASCDVDGDGTAELLTAPGPGRAPTIRVLGLAGGAVTELIAFDAFESDFTGGVSIACADLDSDGSAEVVVGAGPGRIADVNVYSVAAGSVTPRASFTAYEPTFMGGVRVAAGHYGGRAGWLNGFDIVTAPGRGRPADVRLWTQAGAPVAQVAISAAQAGVQPTLGDANGDGRLDLVVAPDDGRPELVRIFDVDSGSLVGDVPGGIPGFPVGVRIALGVLQGGPGDSELVVGNGAGGHPRVRVIFWPPAGPQQRLEILPLEVR